VRYFLAGDVGGWNACEPTAVNITERWKVSRSQRDTELSQELILHYTLSELLIMK